MRPVNFQKEALSEKEKRNIDILKILSRRGPISRPDISREMGINVVTISNYVDDFIKHNLVYEKELDVSEGGRRPTLLDLNSRAGYIIGVGVNLLHMVGVLVDLKGNIITKTQSVPPKSGARELSEAILEITREIFKRSKDFTPAIKGLGVGIAGLINKKTGSIHWPQKMDQYYVYESVDLPLRELLEKESGLPVLIENDATCACFGECWLDSKSNYKNALYMFSGSGCGIMINGEIYTGKNGYAGEVTISNYKDRSMMKCQNGDDCYLSRWETDLGITRQVRDAFSADPSAAKVFSEKTCVQPQDMDLRSIFAAARSGEPVSREALGIAAGKLGVKISYLVNLFDPQAVVIGGGLEEAGDEFLNKVNSTIRDWSFREITDGLKVSYSQLRENAVALGAASLVMQRVFARLV